MIEGVHKVNTEEMKEEVTLLILCATRMEHKSLTEDSPLMMNPLELVLDDGDIHKAIIGFDPSYSLTFVIAGAAFSSSFPFYGMTKTMLSVLPSLNMVFKTGGAIGHSDIGSIVVSVYDTTGMVMEDRWSSDKPGGVSIPRTQGFPSETMYDFSYRLAGVIRSPTTCGGRDIAQESHSCSSLYKWEGTRF